MLERIDSGTGRRPLTPVEVQALVESGAFSPVQAKSEREGWADEVRALLRMSLRDPHVRPWEFQDIYRSFDLEKIAAFAKDVNLSKVPETIYKLLIQEDRDEIMQALIDNKTFDESSQHLSTRDWRRTDGAKMKRGEERIIAGTLYKVKKEGKNLEDRELKALYIMARNIVDKGVLTEMIEFTDRHVDLAEAISKNIIFSDEEIEDISSFDKEELVIYIGNLLLQKADENGNKNEDWAYVIKNIYDKVPRLKNKAIKIIQKYPNCALLLLLEFNLDKDVIRNIFQIKWIKSVIKQPKWDKFLKEFYLYCCRIGGLKATLSVLEMHSDIPNFTYKK